VSDPQRFVLCGWMSGLAVGLSCAFWWSDAITSLSVLAAGVGLTLTTWFAARSRTTKSKS
jgi:hypothetical protein